jgi:hypothetical protein
MKAILFVLSVTVTAAVVLGSQANSYLTSRAERLDLTVDASTR